jgi:S-phase kinase-associated protein 1
MIEEIVEIEEIEIEDIILVSKDFIKFRVPYKHIKISKLIKDMVEELDPEEYLDEDIPSIPEIPLPNVGKDPLEKAIEYATHHFQKMPSTIERPLLRDLKHYVGEWEIEFLKNMSKTLLIEVILAANYLNMTPLLNLTCAFVASNLKRERKTLEEIREMFGISIDFTDEEKKKIIAENDWTK